MSSLVLFDDGKHKNVLLEEFSPGGAVQANQHLIIHDGQGMILDPGAGASPDAWLMERKVNVKNS